MFLRGYISRRAIVAAALVISVVLSISPTLFSPTVKATKLLVVAPTSFIDLGEPTELTLKAIDELGNLDADRDDLVELSLKPVSYSKAMAELSSTSVTLRNGIGHVHILGNVPEVVDVVATWRDGRSPLESSSVRLFIGIGEE
ncbi:hypothetical protein KEJ39_07015 [Candidatus Bathyarchaeota archaeon]|nr:hypothetical protein [Candidatus Bathyarchaeota archaeon]